MRLILALAAVLFAAPVLGQSLSCTQTGWLTNPVAQDKLTRSSGADANGECDWTYYSANKPGRVNSYVLIGKVHAQRVFIDSAATFLEHADGSCATLNYTGVPVGATCPGGVVVPPVVPPPPVNAQAFNVYVVPLQYDPPVQPAVCGTLCQASYTRTLNAYNASVPRLATLPATFAKVSAWWVAETYGLQTLNVIVLPIYQVHKPSPGCAIAAIESDARDWLVTQEIDATLSDRIVHVATYSCSVYGEQVTTGSHVFSMNTSQDAAGQFAHEMGHTFGLWHSGAFAADGSYVVYGNPWDQMGNGRSTVFAHFNGFHKWKLGLPMSPLPCVSQTLRSLYSYLDVMLCDDPQGWYFADYLPDWNQVNIVRAGYRANDDNTLVAALKAGQSYTLTDGHVITHTGAGKVTVQ